VRREKTRDYADWFRLGPKGIARITTYISQQIRDEVEEELKRRKSKTGSQQGNSQSGGSQTGGSQVGNTQAEASQAGHSQAEISAQNSNSGGGSEHHSSSLPEEIEEEDFENWVAQMTGQLNLDDIDSDQDSDNGW
jgi:hypothetical protein